MNASTGFPVMLDPICVTRVELEDARSLLAAFPHCQQYRCDCAAAMTAHEGCAPLTIGPFGGPWWGTAQMN